MDFLLYRLCDSLININCDVQDGSSWSSFQYFSFMRLIYCPILPFVVYSIDTGKLMILIEIVVILPRAKLTSLYLSSILESAFRCG